MTITNASCLHFSLQWNTELEYKRNHRRHFELCAAVTMSRNYQENLKLRSTKRCYFHSKLPSLITVLNPLTIQGHTNMP